MTKSEYMALIDGFLANTDDLSSITKIKEALSTDIDTLDSLVLNKAELETKVTELRDTNLKLFLRTGTTLPETVVEKDKTDEDIFDELIVSKIIKETK